MARLHEANRSQIFVSVGAAAAAAAAAAAIGSEQTSHPAREFGPDKFYDPH